MYVCIKTQFPGKCNGQTRAGNLVSGAFKFKDYGGENPGRHQSLKLKKAKKYYKNAEKKQASKQEKDQVTRVKWNAILHTIRFKKSGI